MNISDLKVTLKMLGVNSDRYDLEGGIPARSEGLILTSEGEDWFIRHFERGSLYILGRYKTEEEACFAFIGFAKDPFYRT